MLTLQIVQLAEIIVDWNVNKTYCSYKLQGKSPNEVNCQDFVDAILNKLQISYNYTGTLANYINEMRLKGNCEMAFKPNQKFREHFGLTHENYVFRSHQELDDFVNKFYENLIDFEEERTLLKAFDRAFWCRHVHDPAEPLYHQTRKGCPFKSPFLTGSYAGGW